MRRLPLVAGLLCVLLASTTAQAAPIYVDLGTAAPPGTLGGQALTPFADDPRPIFTNVTSVASPLGGSITFSSSVNAREIGVGNGWLTWSHGYTGDVYYSNGAQALDWTLPSGTTAFYFYVEPEPFVGFFSFTVIASDGTETEATASANGNAGARGFGFYVTSGVLQSISVSTNIDFAVGEFGIARGDFVPEPATLSLLALAVLAAARRARRKY